MSTVIAFVTRYARISGKERQRLRWLDHPPAPRQVRLGRSSTTSPACWILPLGLIFRLIY